MHLPQLIEQFEPETDPLRRHVQVFLAVAWSAFPNEDIPVLVDWAIVFAGRGIVVDRGLVEEIALEMLYARGAEVAA